MCTICHSGTLWSHSPHKAICGEVERAERTERAEKWRSGGGGNDEAEVKVKVEAEMNVEAEARAEVKAGGMKMGGTKVVEGGWQVEDLWRRKIRKSGGCGSMEKNV